MFLGVLLSMLLVLLRMGMLIGSFVLALFYLSGEISPIRSFLRKFNPLMSVGSAFDLKLTFLTALTLATLGTLYGVKLTLGLVP